MGEIPVEPAVSEPMPTPVVERKIKPDGSVREYTCELLHLEPTLAVVRFRLPEGGSPFGAPIAIPPGSVSDGYFWTRRPYNLYRMRDANGAIAAHRFDAVTAVRLSREAIEYRDLVLDWWVTPGGEVLEEDREEFDELMAAGKVTPEDAAAVAEATRQVYSRYRHIIDDVAALERRLKLVPPGK